ncbi:membrane protein [Actinomycetes bacterium]|nr:membrane protein [Actinomycetes bacterium]
MRGLGTLINTATVLVGGGLGLIIGNRIPDRVRTIIVQVIGLVTIAIGLRDVIKTDNMVFPLVGMVLGAIVGEMLRIEDRLESLGEILRRKFSKSGNESKFVTGFVTATLLFCVGPLTILGAIEDASGKTPQLYIVKGTLDGFMMIIFSAVYGVGAIFSAASVFVVQGSLTLFGTSLDSLLDDRMRLELFSAGGLAVLAIGLNLLEIKKIRLGSMLPGLVITPLLVWIFATPNGLIH